MLESRQRDEPESFGWVKRPRIFSEYTPPTKALEVATAPVEGHSVEDIELSEGFRKDFVEGAMRHTEWRYKVKPECDNCEDVGFIRDRDSDNWFPCHSCGVPR